MARSPTVTQVEAPSAAGARADFAPQNVRTSPDMFGGMEARALDGLGRQAAGAGQSVANVFLEQAARDKAIADDTEMTNLRNSFTEKSGELWGRYSALAGQEAVDAYPQFQQELAALRDSTVGQASNAGVTRALNRTVGGTTAGMLGQAAGANARNVRVAGATAQDSAATLAINAGAGAGLNTEQQSIALTNGLLAVQRKGALLGWDDTTQQAQAAAFRGKFYSAAVLALADKDPLAAQALFQANRTGMDAQTQISLDNHLRTPVRNALATNIVGNVTGNGMGNGSLPNMPGTPGNTQGGIGDQVWAAEGGEGKNPTSSARGGGITDGTWATYAARLGLPASLRGTREGFDKVWSAYQADARQAIGRDLNPREQYTAWLLGVAGAKAFIMAPPGADAKAIYAAASNQNIADQAFRSNGSLLRPGATVAQSLQAIGDYFERKGGAAATASTRSGSGMAGRDAQMAAALAAAGNDPELRTSVLGKLNQQWSVEDAMNSQERSRMTQRIEALSGSLALGTDVTIPEPDIRRLFQPEQAQQIIDGLSVKKVEGQVFRAVQLATPEGIAAMQADLANGTGALTQQLRERRGTIVGPDGKVADEDAPADTVARANLGQVLNRALEARAGQLRADPAQYVMADPTVRAAAAAQQANPSDPAAMNNYITSTLAAQERLGVPEANRRVLAVNVAAGEAARLMGNDPAAGADGKPDNAALRLQSMSRQYGDHWPRVFGDLVRDGKLPAAYQVLANIATPVGQADFQRMLNLQRSRGSHAAFASGVPDAEKKLIDSGLDKATEAFRTSATAGQQQSGAQLASDVRDNVRDLAYYYAMQGMNASSALQTATDRVYNDKYEFNGTMRVPKQLPNGQPLGVAAAQRSAGILLRAMKPDDLAAPDSSNPALTEADRRQTAWSAAQRGVWVPNQNDTGLVLMSQWEMGARMPVRRRDGSMVEMRYDNMPVASAQPEPGRGFRSPGAQVMQFGGTPVPSGFEPAGAQPGTPNAPAAPALPATGPAPVSTAPIVPGTEDSRRLRGSAARGTGRWTRPGVEP